MLALAIELLSGRYVASAYNDRDRVEWPPHPARLFSALTATWADGEPESSEGNDELAALRWLEQQPPPRILATPIEHAGQRDVVPVFVPVNDASIISPPDRAKLDTAIAMLHSAVDPKARAKAEREVMRLSQKLIEDTRRVSAAPAKFGKSEPAAAERLLPERRTRQPRTFPSATPEEPTVVFIWEDLVPDNVLSALERLLSRIARLGHSSTPVTVRRVTDATVTRLAARTTWFVPDDAWGDLVIRWVSPGQVDRLAQAFELHHEIEPRVLPARFVRYSEGVAEPSAEAPRSVFDTELIVFARVGGPRLPSVSTVGLAHQFRRALLSAADAPVLELLSGHQADGTAADRPHVAVIPLPFVGHEHADGALLGIGLALPSACSEDERRAVHRAIGQLEAQCLSSPAEDAPTVRLLLGDAGVLELERVAWGESSRKTLRAGTWTRASRFWASATPVALDRNPGDLHDSDAAKRRAAFAVAVDLVRTAVTRVAPEAARLLRTVDVVRSCVLPGTAKPRTFPRFPIDKARPQRVLVHVRLVFDEPVCGPLLVGAGRYYGLGLCMPLDGGHERTRPHEEEVL